MTVRPSPSADLSSPCRTAIARSSSAVKGSSNRSRFGIMQKRASHRQPLPHPPREFAHQPVAHAVKPGTLQPFHRRGARIRDSIQPSKQPQILERRQLFVNPDAVPQHANPLASTLSPRIPTKNRNIPPSRLRQPRQHPKQRSLPSPIAPNQSKTGAARHIQADIRERRKIPKKLPDTVNRDRAHANAGRE